MGTLKVVGTLDDNVDFSLPSTTGNSYVNLNTINLSSGDGTDGIITLTALTQSQIHEVNVSHIKTISVLVDTVTAGSVDVKVSGNASGNTSNKVTKLSLAPGSISPGVVTSYIDPTTNRVVEHFKIITSTGATVYEDFKYADGTPYLGLVSALTPTVQSEIELQMFKDPLTNKPVIATTRYNPNGAVAVGYPTYTFLDGTTLPGQPATVATLVFPQDQQYGVDTSYWVDNVPVANTIKIKYTILKDGVIQPLSGFVTLIDGTASTLSVNAVPYDNEKSIVTFQNVTQLTGTGGVIQLRMKEDTDKVTGVITRSFFTTNGAVATTPTSWMYGDLKFHTVTTEAFDTTTNTNVRRERTYNSLTNALVGDQWIGLNGVVVTAPTTYELGYTERNSEAIKDDVEAIKNTLLTEDFAQEATLSLLNAKIVQTAKGIKTKSVITDGVSDVDVRPLTNTNALNIAVVDANGDQITSFGVAPGSNDLFSTQAVINGLIFAGVTTPANNTTCITINLNNTITAGFLQLEVDVNGTGVFRAVQLNNRTLGTIVGSISTSGTYTANIGSVNAFRFVSTVAVVCPALTTISWQTTIGFIPDIIVPTVSSNSLALSQQSSVTLGGTAQQILAANPLRQGFEIQNNSTLDLRLAFGSTASATDGFIIKANEGSYSSSSRVSTGLVSIFGTTTGQQFTFIEYV